MKFVMKDHFIAPKMNPTVPFPLVNLDPATAARLGSQAIELQKEGLNNRAIASRLGIPIAQAAQWTYAVPKHAIRTPIDEPAWTPQVVSAGDTIAVVECPDRYYPAIPSSESHRGRPSNPRKEASHG